MLDNKRWALVVLLSFALVVSACVPAMRPAPTPTPTPTPRTLPRQERVPMPEQPPAEAPSVEADPGPAPAQFYLRDIAAEAGLGDFRHGAFIESLAEDPVAMMGAGLCVLDYDDDGYLDLYVVNSHALHEVALWEARGGLPHNVLYRNRGDGTFEDVSRGSGADLVMRGNGCVAGDLTGNGLMDIYVTADGPNALLINQGDGTFVDVAEQAGVTAPEWSAPAAIADVNGNGLMDIFVGAYIDLEKTVETPIGIFPQDYLGLPDRLYINQGDGTWVDMAAEYGLLHEERTLGAVFSDLSGNGYLDLFIANDGHPNRLYLNLGDGTFVDVTEQAGVGDRDSGMGVAIGDYTGNGALDIVVTNWDREHNSVYRNRLPETGELTFEYATHRIGVAGFGVGLTGWGVSWVDLNHDTHLDLLVANGRVPITDLEADREDIRLLQNRGDGTFLDVSRFVGLREVGQWLGRGMVVADFNNDGQREAVIASIAGGLCLLRAENVTGNWLTVGLTEFAPGAKMLAELPDGRILVREWHAGSSYLASEDPRFHLGLGEYDAVPRLRVVWPDGRWVELRNVAANQFLTLSAGMETEYVWQQPLANAQPGSVTPTV